MRKFIAYFVAVSALLMTAVAYHNYVYDGTGVLNRDLSGVRMTPNQTFCKVRYVIENPQKYDSFCFGSSRVANLDLKKIQDGGKWYNMTYAAGTPQQWLHDLREILAHGVHVSTVLVGIDDMTWKDESIKVKNADAYKHSYTDWDFSYYMGLLFHMPSPLPSPAMAQEKGSIFDLYDTGRTFSTWIDERAEKNPEAYRKDPKFLSPYVYPDNGCYAEHLEALVELNKLAEEYGFRLVFFMNPVAASTYLAEDQESLKKWKRDIAEIADFYDFTGMNDFNTDNFNFLETSHYREILGDKMLDRMMNGAPETVPGFGTLVTKENLDSHEEMLATQKANWLASHPQEAQWYAVGRGLAPLPDGLDTDELAGRMSFNIDVIDGHELRTGINVHKLSEQLVLGGWFLTGGETPRWVMACLTDGGGSKSYVVMRQDFRLELIGKLGSSVDPAHAWFFVHVDVSGLSAGSYELSFLAEDKDGKYWQSGPVAHIEMEI